MRPPSICTTAAPRPIVAIVPLSWYSNGFGLLARDPAGDRLAGVLAGLERDRSELRQDLLGLRVGDRGDVAEDVDLGMVGKREVGADARCGCRAAARSPSELDELVALQARRPRRACAP